jgi:hypothetical protein
MFVLNSNHKGAIAEAEIAVAAIRQNVPVFKPLSEHGRTDLVLEIAGKLWRVQCKWGRLSHGKDVVIVHLGGCRLSPAGYVRTTYGESEVDLFGVYCGELDRSFLLPVSVAADRQGVHLRLRPPGNNQRACINLAADYDFEGAVAQLGERRRGTAEVRGSSPLSSTSPSSIPITVGANPFRDQLGYWMDRAALGEDLVITRHGKPRVRLSSAGALLGGDGE